MSCSVGPSDVIPAKAEIQAFSEFLDPGLRRGEGAYITVFLS